MMILISLRGKAHREKSTEVVEHKICVSMGKYRTMQPISNRPLRLLMSQLLLSGGYLLKV